MNYVNEQFLAALRAGLSGEKADMTLTGEEWAKLLRLAQDHKLLPMILEAVHGCPSLQSMDAGGLALFKRQARQQVMMQTLRTEEFLALNRQLREAGVRPLVVKGIVCRSLYPQPDQRPSGDEDVLVDQVQFDHCCRLLTELGLEAAEEKDTASYEIPFRKPGSPLHIELHWSLFPRSSGAYGHLEEYFDGVLGRAVELEIQGTPVRTMAPTDHLFYLICHALKHFLHSGFGIRQVCDIVLFADRYGPEVEWERILNNCEAIRAEKFAAAVFRIGERHLGVAAPAAFRGLEVDEGPMLSDLLEGGLYGDATMSRRHSSNITLEAAAAQKQGKRARSVLRTSVFPSVQVMSGKYPYLKEKPWLLPVAWGQRLLRYSRETRAGGDNSAGEAMKIGTERIELMRRYGILDEK